METTAQRFPVVVVRVDAGCACEHAVIESWATETGNIE